MASHVSTLTKLSTIQNAARGMCAAKRTALTRTVAAIQKRVARAIMAKSTTASGKVGNVLLGLRVQHCTLQC